MYTLDYFIQKFEKLNNWCIGIRTDEYGNHCALGHCSPNNYGSWDDETPESGALSKLFFDNKIFYPGYDVEVVHGVAAVNNGTHPKYQQPTPKQRILAALQDIKKMQQPQYPDIRKELAVFEIGDKTDLPVLTPAKNI